MKLFYAFVAGFVACSLATFAIIKNAQKIGVSSLIADPRKLGLVWVYADEKIIIGKELGPDEIEELKGKFRAAWPGHRLGPIETAHPKAFLEWLYTIVD